MYIMPLHVSDPLIFGVFPVRERCGEEATLFEVGLVEGLRMGQIGINEVL